MNAFRYFSVLKSYSTRLQSLLSCAIAGLSNTRPGGAESLDRLESSWRPVENVECRDLELLTVFL